MRFNAALTSALVSSASIMGYAHAEETEKKPETTSLAEKPTFTVSISADRQEVLPRPANYVLPAHLHRGSFLGAVHR